MRLCCKSSPSLVETGHPRQWSACELGMFHIIGIKMRYGHFIGIPEVFLLSDLTMMWDMLNGARSLYILYTN